MVNPLSILIKNQGQSYKVERNNVIICELEGLPNHETSTRKAYIGFIPTPDITIGDWLINSVDERVYVKDTGTDYFQKKPHQFKAYYLTENEYKNSTVQSSAPVFNIQNAVGSVIGTQTNFTLNYNDIIRNTKESIDSSLSEDKETLNQIVSLLEMVVNNQIPVSKGLFSKFSDVMERNSWITGSITSAILSWLTTRVI